MKNTHASKLFTIKTASTYEIKSLMALSFGRILSLGSRPEKPGDVMEYEKHKWLIIEAAQELRERGQL